MMIMWSNKKYQIYHLFLCLGVQGTFIFWVHVTENPTQMYLNSQHCFWPQHEVGLNLESPGPPPCQALSLALLCGDVVSSDGQPDASHGAGLHLHELYCAEKRRLASRSSLRRSRITFPEISWKPLFTCYRLQIAHRSNLEPNTGKGLTFDKSHCSGIKFRWVRPTLEAWEGHAPPETHRFCGGEINTWATDSVT